MALLEKTPRRRALVMDERHVLGIMLRESSEYNIMRFQPVISEVWRSSKDESRGECLERRERVH